MSESQTEGHLNLIGFLKYEGKLVEDGILDAKSAAKALFGFDHALRYFITQEQPELAMVEFPIPVQIKRGSWLAAIPSSAEGWLIAALGIAGTAYLTKAASKMADRDFAEVGLKDVFKKALTSVQWMIKIGKHLGTLAHKGITGLRWADNNEKVGIPNGNGDFLFVPRREFERFLECPFSIISEMAGRIEIERQLSIGVNRDGKIEEVIITRVERAIFFAEEDEAANILFPDMADGKQVELVGIVTKGNERTNSIGFLFEEHVITCYPKQGSIVRFKPHLFLKCRIIGVVTRENNETGEKTDPRPKIIFDDLVIIEEDDQGRLI